MFEILWVGIGGFIGAILRYVTSVWVQSLHNTGFPAGTLLVNVVGCFLIGLLMTLFERAWVPASAKLFLGSGLLGAFTTFSTFSWETLDLIRAGAWVSAAGNILGNLLLGMVAVALGLWLGRAY